MKNTNVKSHKRKTKNGVSVVKSHSRKFKQTGKFSKTDKAKQAYRKATRTPNYAEDGPMDSKSREQVARGADAVLKNKAKKRRKKSWGAAKAAARKQPTIAGKSRALLKGYLPKRKYNV